MDQKISTNDKNLQEQLNHARRELTVIYEVSNAMRTTLELNNILYVILTGVTAHTGLGFNRAILFLVNAKERCLEPKMAIGPESGEHAHKIWEYIANSTQHFDDLINEDNINQNTTPSSLFQSIKDLRIPLDSKDENLLSMAYRQGAPLHIPKGNIAQYANDKFLKIFKATELIVMPLKAKDKVNGLIIADNLYTQKPITPNELRIFTMLANQAGLAIENSRLYEMIMHKSHTDSLTNLWNHGYFQDQLNKEFNNAQKNNQPLSLFITDIDDFKKLNDMYGHQNGDMILKELATIIKESSREIDYACRYGGEEFSMILPQTNKEQAYLIAERLRQRIEKYEFTRFSSNEKLKITISIGVSTFPEDASQKEELIEKADKAMYIAKFGGKNQTILS